MNKAMFKCSKSVCFGNINFGTGYRCKVLDEPIDDTCPFYKADPDGTIAEKIEYDIKRYARQKLKGEK